MRKLAYFITDKSVKKKQQLSCDSIPSMPLTSCLGVCFVIPPRCNKAAVQIGAPNYDVLRVVTKRGFSQISQKSAG